ncbi:hypothetical protein IEQ34_023680 [Dendrobium chrysotoxum]|uniref:Uncharacterized protein n=1 Tax=Dendrobium chrysotoxum TaxID=161865 RepID=A0AAV7FUA4_DENCH|nr:hypothetical protein IEQ34_023680 [Dendrobium chrysotoxum]
MLARNPKRFRFTRLTGNDSILAVEQGPAFEPIRCSGLVWYEKFGKEYITASLIREFLMIAVSRMLDPLLFYVLPESVPIPMLCGAEHLLFAGIKLFLCRGLVQ